jgi:hypothetical protein
MQTTKALGGVSGRVAQQRWQPAWPQRRAQQQQQHPRKRVQPVRSVAHDLVRLSGVDMGVEGCMGHGMSMTEVVSSCVV